MAKVADDCQGYFYVKSLPRYRVIVHGLVGGVYIWAISVQAEEP